VLRRDKRIIVAGLSEDFRGVPFKTIACLTMLADYVTKKEAVCMQYQGPATKSQRLLNGEPV